MMNQEQKQMFNTFSGLPREQQAQRIADLCNKNGITKEQLSNYMKQLYK